jgi:succinate dehydrogenase / fumarate reductase flavoprotein subunit
MGGIPTTEFGEVQDSRQGVVAGLYAVGECAAASYHGFNRLGTNSILELITMGKMVAERVVDFIEKEPGTPREAAPELFAEKFSRYLDAAGKDSLGEIRNTMRAMMTENVSVFRTEQGIEKAIETLRELKDRAEKTALSGTGFKMNQELVQRWELDNLLAVAMVIARAALERKESRGAHFRDDYPDRKDEYNYHTLVSMGSFDELVLNRREIDRSIFEEGGEHCKHFDYIERKY